MAALLSGRPPITPRPALDLAASNKENSIYPFEGRYFNPGYGEIELCAVGVRNRKGSASCNAVVDSLDDMLPGVFSPALDPPSLVFKSDSIFITHYKLSAFGGDVFNVSLWRSQEDVEVPTHSRGRNITDSDYSQNSMTANTGPGK